MGEYVEFPGLCFVDTLDNTHACASTPATWTTCSGSVSDDNISACRMQNSRRISVIIATLLQRQHRLNENENN